MRSFSKYIKNNKSSSNNTDKNNHNNNNNITSTTTTAAAAAGGMTYRRHIQLHNQQQSFSPQHRAGKSSVVIFTLVYIWLMVCLNHIR
ncbi:hypothetical protein PoB_004450300 [Plakobranchus ocellatus]|uniref:Uncharacterized protein n=1 Tax=Plakobranchus ocellatus TaxID=259542 RepID=A0AAV4BGN0_9GAST|nr:hypothetical protein PoB_004450300 [Plakobranchus ocellatus]